MDWGVMQGLGEGLMGFGNTITKQALDEKLRKAREDREDQLEDRRFQRQQNMFKGHRYTKKQVGDETVWYEQDINNAGKVMDERLAPKDKIEEFNAEEEERRIGNLEKSLRVRVLEDELEYRPTLRRLNEENIRAQIDQRRSSGLASLARASGVGGRGNAGSSQAPTLVGSGEATDELVRDYKTLVDSYTKGADAKLTMAEVYDLARKVQIAAAKEKAAGKPRDIGDTFRRALENLVKTK